MEVSDKRYLYNIITNGIFELDDMAIDILNGKFSNYSEQESLGTIEFMKSKFIIQTKSIFSGGIYEYQS